MAAEQEAKGFIFYKGKWITKDEYDKLTKPEVKETKKAKYVFEPITTLPPKPKKISSPSNNYQDKLGKVSNLSLKDNKFQSYYLYLPKNYTEDKEWPLFIGVHGYMADANQAMDLWKGFADTEGFILVCPNFKDGYQRLEYASDYRLIDVIKETQKDFRMDKEKILLAGFSGGGMFVSRFVFRHPNIVRAASIMSARWYDLYSIKSSVKTDFLVTVGEDDTERIKDAKKFTEKLKEKGYNVKFKTFPNVGHWVCDEAKRLTIELFREMIK